MLHQEAAKVAPGPVAQPLAQVQRPSSISISIIIIIIISSSSSSGSSISISIISRSSNNNNNSRRSSSSSSSNSCKRPPPGRRPEGRDVAEARRQQAGRRHEVAGVRLIITSVIIISVMIMCVIVTSSISISISIRIITIIFVFRGARLPFTDSQQMSVQGTRALDPGSVRADWEYHKGNPALE